jgi:hypothetical protein
MFQNYLRTLFLISFSCIFNSTFAKAETENFHQALRRVITEGAHVRYEKFDDRGIFEEKAILPVLSSAQFKSKKPNHRFFSQDSKNTANKINLVLIGDGYTRNEMDLFRKQAKIKVSELFSQEPLQEYKNYFNVIIVESESEKSGIADSVEESGQTAFGMYFNCAKIERLICIDLEKVSDVLNSLPKVDMVFALANTEKYGGAGYLSPAIATLAAGNMLSTELALHEFGHSFGKLTDEYEDDDYLADCDQYANASLIDSHQMKNEKKKWHSWLNLSHIGTFSGGCYNKKIYRPTDVSKMRSLRQPFYEVNSEQIIKQIYKNISVLNFTEYTSLRDGHFEIKINPIQNKSKSVKISWFANGLELKELKNRYRISSKSLNISRNDLLLTALLKDETTKIRDEEFRSLHMTKKLSWKINPKP